jgi:energy-coupling factor transporter transmembrane protein EcfT
MNQSKFSLGDLISLLTAIAFGFVCFLSSNFYTLGNSIQSIILAVIITLLLSGTALGAKLLKRTSRNFKPCFIWEIILLVLFTGLMMLFSYSPFPHFFIVNGQKEEIQSKLNVSIMQAENMFAKYEQYAETRKNLYRATLRSVVNAKNTNPSEYATYGFKNNGIADDTQIKDKMVAINADLYPSNYKEMKKSDSTWLANARNIVVSWKPIGIVSVVKEVEQNSKSWLDELVKFSSKRETGEQAQNFPYNLSFDDVETHFTRLGKPTPLTIGLAVIAYLLMLFSYWITKRDTRFPGLKLLFSAGKTAINEL